MDEKDVKIKKEYVSGMSMKNSDIRKYKLTIMNGVKKGKFFIEEVTTPVIDEFEYGESEITYIANNKEYKSAIDAFNEL